MFLIVIGLMCKIIAARDSSDSSLWNVDVDITIVHGT